MKQKQAFVSDEMSTIARIHFNEYGFSWSWILAKKYVDSAKKRVEDIKNPVSRRDLLTALQKINRDCDYLLWYDTNLQKFKTKQTIGFIQKVTKKVIILLSLWDMSQVHSGISHQLRNFHSAICDLLHPKKSNNTQESQISQKSV